MWDQEGTCSGHAGTDVLAFDRVSSRIRMVTANHRSSEPTTHGAWIAWKQVKRGQEQDSRLLDGDIVLQRVSSGRRSIVSDQHKCTDPQTGSGSCATAPHLINGVLAWQALDGATVEVLELATRRHQTLARPIEGKLFHTTPGFLGFSRGKQLVWTPSKVNEQTSHGVLYLTVAEMP